VGLVYALAAYLSWGLLVPVHFRMLGAFSPNHILAERIVWSSLFAGALALALAARKRLHLPLPLRPRHALLAVSAVMIGINWLLYLYAIDRGHLLDASLGYYINPLVSVAFGRIVLGERLRPLQAVAVGIAAAGVAVAVVWAGELPILSLSLAVSFALYGLVRKIVGVDALVGFLTETLLLLPAAIAWLILSPEPFLPAEPKNLALLMLTGLTTALPLIWFAAAAVPQRPGLRRACGAAPGGDVRPDLGGARALQRRRPPRPAPRRSRARDPVGSRSDACIRHSMRPAGR
jgi:chloramphenicol-sensitive protein RarD